MKITFYLLLLFSLLTPLYSQPNLHLFYVTEQANPLAESLAHDVEIFFDSVATKTASSLRVHRYTSQTFKIDSLSRIAPNSGDAVFFFYFGNALLEAEKSPVIICGDAKLSQQQIQDSIARNKTRLLVNIFDNFDQKKTVLDRRTHTAKNEDRLPLLFLGGRGQLQMYNLPDPKIADLARATMPSQVLVSPNPIFATSPLFIKAIEETDSGMWAQTLAIMQAPTDVLLKPALTQRISVQEEVKPASKKIVEVPAQYETVSEVQKAADGTSKTVTKSVLKKAAFTKEEVVLAEYKTVVKEVVTPAEYTKIAFKFTTQGALKPPPTAGMEPSSPLRPAETKVEAIESISMIAPFPWPPPKASARAVIRASQFKRATNLKMADQVLDKALSKMGYYDKSYYTVPNGFAVATKLEQINKDASSKTEPDRWSAKPTANDLSFSDYLSALFFTQTGYFRVIVFVVTDKAFTSSGVAPSREQTLSWVSDGAQSLPKEIGEIPFTENFAVTALIYEYELPENSKKAALVVPGKFSGNEHLKKSKLFSELTK